MPQPNAKLRFDLPDFKSDPKWEEMTAAEIEAYMQENGAMVDALRAQNERAHAVLEVKEAMDRQAAIARRPPNFPAAQGFGTGVAVGALPSADLNALKETIETEIARRGEKAVSG